MQLNCGLLVVSHLFVKMIEKLVAQLATIDGVKDFAITTNAVLLPDKAQMLADAGLRRVTVSLDSIDDDVFQKNEWWQSNSCTSVKRY